MVVERKKTENEYSKSICSIAADIKRPYSAVEGAKSHASWCYVLLVPKVSVGSFRGLLFFSSSV